MLPECALDSAGRGRARVRQLPLHGGPDTDRRGRPEPPPNHRAPPRRNHEPAANPPGAHPRTRHAPTRRPPAHPPRTHQAPARAPAVNPPGARPRTRHEPATTAPRRPPAGDANAPPQRALWRPNAPSTPVVRAVAPRNHRRRFSANSASRVRTRTRSVHLRTPPGTGPAAYGPGDVTRPPDRSAARGDVGGGVPQPAGSSTAGRPTHRPWKRSRRGRRRAHARAHGHTSGARDNRPYIHRT